MVLYLYWLSSALRIVLGSLFAASQLAPITASQESAAPWSSVVLSACSVLWRCLLVWKLHNPLKLKYFVHKEYFVEEARDIYPIELIWREEGWKAWRSVVWQCWPPRVASSAIPHRRLPRMKPATWPRGQPMWWRSADAYHRNTLWITYRSEGLQDDLMSPSAFTLPILPSLSLAVTRTLSYWTRSRILTVLEPLPIKDEAPCKWQR